MTGISVPRGGGALSGIGETFHPDLHTGTANLSVPIPLPPGRGDLSPRLELAYCSGSGNGPFGLGWSLPVPQVSRRTDRGVPLYDDHLDTFVLSAGEELLRVPLGAAAPPDLPSGASATRYRPATEAAFDRILHVASSSDDYWEVWSRDGLRSRYGTKRPDEADEAWTDHATVRSPEGAVFRWLLSSTQDSLGNVIRYEYTNDGGAQLYLSRVRYADYGDPADSAFAVTVTLAYNTRPDPFSDRRAGFDLRTAWRATRVSVSTVGSGDDPITTVELGYADEDPQVRPAGLVSMLSRVQITGHGATVDDTQVLPPLTFDYGRWQPASRRFLRLPSTLPAGLGPAHEVVDLFGDGLPSVLQLDHSSARYWRNRGEGKFDPPRPLDSAPSGARLGDPGTALVDVDGDGRPELVVTAGGASTVWSLAAPDGRAGFDPRPRRATAAPTVAYTDPQVRMVDVTVTTTRTFCSPESHPESRTATETAVSSQCVRCRTSRPPHSTWPTRGFTRPT